jgi:hypothetical protein
VVWPIFFADQRIIRNPYLHCLPPRGYRPDHDFLESLSLAEGKDIGQAMIGGSIYHLNISLTG